MGKTVVSILVIAAAIAVNVIPGVGQALSAALLSAGISISAGAALTLATLAIATAGALLLQPGKPKLPKPETAESSIKTPTPPRVSAYGRSRLFGAYILYENTDWSTGSDIFSPLGIDIYAIHDGLIDGIEQRYLGDDKITVSSTWVNQLSSGAYGSLVSAHGTFKLVNWYESLGTTPGTANWASIISSLPGKWTTNHRGDGVVCVGIIWHPVGSDKFSEKFPNGTPEASITARWQKVFDWRDETQDVSDPDTWKWSENAVLHLCHYRLVREKARKSSGAIMPDGTALQEAWDTFFAPTVDYWTEAANVADEDVPLKAGGTEKRYRSCFAHKHTDAHKDVLDSLTSCFDGWTAPRWDGALVVYAGKYYEPTVEIGPDEIVSYSWQYGVNDEESVNELKVTYMSPDHDYNAVEADPWRDTDDMLDRGAVRTKGEDFMVPSHAQVRRLAKRLMARIMSPNRGTITTNAAGRIVRGERYIRLTIREAGVTFFDGVVEILALSRNVQTGGVTFSWIEITENIDAWNAATEEGDPAPVKPKIVPAELAAPVITSASILYDASATAGVGSRIRVTLDGPSGIDLIWYLRWRRVDDAVWNEQQYVDVDSSSGVELISGFVPIDKDLEVEVAYKVSQGQLSPWSSPATDVSTDTELVAPDDAVSITLLSWSDTMELSTPAIPRASTYRWRFYKSDGTTLKRTITTSGPSVSYSKNAALTDGAERAYIVDVAGVNGAGIGGTAVTGTLTNAAPAAPTGVSATGGTYIGSVSFTAPGDSDLAGLSMYFSTTSGFDPMTTGTKVNGLGSPIKTSNLAAGTYYAKVAAFDTWSEKPSLLNFSSEVSFTISTGVGGGGGDTGGYCVVADEPLLLADGSQGLALDRNIGDLVRTQHEQTMEWGDYPIEAVEIVDEADIWEALGIRGSKDHRVWINGWVKLGDIGRKLGIAEKRRIREQLGAMDGSAAFEAWKADEYAVNPTLSALPVVRFTVTDAHTYVARGVLSHNAKIPL